MIIKKKSNIIKKLQGGGNEVHRILASVRREYAEIVGK
jgi:hypothetical protein